MEGKVAVADSSRLSPADKFSGHAFISYVREDSQQVGRLRARLEAAGVPVWLDTDKIAPGDDWPGKIRRAINDDALVFVACFSANSVSRAESFQNEELNQAIEQLRRRQPTNPWLIPVRFSDCQIPNLDIGGGRTLSQLSYVDIFGDREEEGAKQLIKSVLRALRPQTSSPDEYVASHGVDRARIIKTVTVAAEWALWGRGRNDLAYHILRCSSGEFSPGDFSRLLDRYSPGDLENLPEVALSWIASSDLSMRYLAMIIYEEGIDRYGRVTDVAGREVTYARYFCVRYADIAGRFLTYRAMFEGFRACRLTAGGLEPIRAELSVEPARPVRGWLYELARHVAALLLTTRPVCILGADRVLLDDRLWFIDTVMSLLPYGLRSSMSAATWVNTTQHHFRLFFAASHHRCEQAISWDRPEPRDAGDAAARMYLRWLDAAQPRATELVASMHDPMRFSQTEIRRMIAELPFLLDDRMAAATALEFMSEALQEGDYA
jgi:hypothetical protein